MRKMLASEEKKAGKDTRPARGGRPPAEGAHEGGPEAEKTTKAQHELQLVERLDVAGLETYVEKEGHKAQPMARRLLEAAREAGAHGLETGYKKPEGGGRSVAIGDSAQKLQREPRNAAMKAYTGMDIAGSHLVMANALTGGTFGALAELCRQYEATLAELAAKTCTNRAGAKNFYLSILNGGSVEAWRKRNEDRVGEVTSTHGSARLTEHAWRYLRQVKELRRAIVSSNPSAAAAAEARGKSAMTLVLFEAEDRTLRKAKEVAEGRGWEVELFLYDTCTPPEDPERRSQNWNAQSRGRCPRCGARESNSGAP